MKKLGTFLLVALIVVLSLIPSTVFATYGYDYGRTSDLIYAGYCVGYADTCWSTLGHNYSSYLGSSYTKSTCLNNVKYGDGFYTDTHGSSSLFLDNGSGYIYYSDVSANRNGNWYKLVFVDACDSGDYSSQAGSFGIANDDGRLYHTIRKPDGTWTSKGDLGTVLGLTSGVIAVSAATDGVSGEAQYALATSDGRLYHTIRKPDGNWTGKGDLSAELGLGSSVTSVAATGDGVGGQTQYAIATSGGYHTYVGWNGYSYDNATYAGFTRKFFYMVQNRNPIDYSLWYAGYYSGISNYRSYGNTAWSY